MSLTLHRSWKSQSWVVVLSNNMSWHPRWCLHMSCFVLLPPQPRHIQFTIIHDTFESCKWEIWLFCMWEKYPHPCLFVCFSYLQNSDHCSFKKTQIAHCFDAMGYLQCIPTSFMTQFLKPHTSTDYMSCCIQLHMLHWLTGKLCKAVKSKTDITIIIRADFWQNETTGDIRHVHTRSQQLPCL